MNDDTNADDGPVEADVIEVLEMMRPALQMDGGDMEYHGIDDGFVKVRLIGACSSCPSATMTLQFGLEKTLKEKVPGVKGIIPV